MATIRISATEARRHFARLLERVLQGDRVIIERHGRAVASIEPIAEQPGIGSRAVAQVRGVPENAPIARLFRGRAEARLAAIGPKAARAIERLAQLGVKARLIGSLARGTVRHDSDIDILIEDAGGLDDASIEAAIREQLVDTPFDIVFGDRMPKRLRGLISP